MISLKQSDFNPRAAHLYHRCPVTAWFYLKVICKAKPIYAICCSLVVYKDGPVRLYVRHFFPCFGHTSLWLISLGRGFGGHLHGDIGEIWGLALSSPVLHSRALELRCFILWWCDVCHPGHIPKFRCEKPRNYMSDLGGGRSKGRNHLKCYKATFVWHKGESGVGAKLSSALHFSCNPSLLYSL